MRKIASAKKKLSSFKSMKTAIGSASFMETPSGAGVTPAGVGFDLNFVSAGATPAEVGIDAGFS